ncbi:MAG: hypothetical protein GX962_08525 [Epulopiscium sp.]|nr:hypothetical protein [Candidatus Epulonipiscium sp.]
MKIDPIEETQEFKDAIKKIQPELDKIGKELDEMGMRMGSCHIYWARKKKLLKSVGIDWKSPSEMNPDIRFD